MQLMPNVDLFKIHRLSSESVIAMAETVGVNITEDIAGALGELTIRKLRYATMVD